MRRTALRLARRHLVPGHRATVPSGVALGCLLVTAAALAGPVGLAPLPAPQAPDPAAAPGTALSAAQPQVRQSLLASDDLAPGYSPTPAVSAPAPRAGEGGAAARSGGGTRTAAPGRPGTDPGAEPMPPPGGLPEALPVDGGDGCARLFGAPWDVAAGERPLAAAPQLADHVDPARGARLRQALGGFAADGATAALAALRDAAAACPRFTATLADGTRVRVTLAPPQSPPRSPPQSPPPSPPPNPTPARAERAPAEDAYAVDVTAVADDGRGWTGYLAADRVGPVLSVLLHIGPPGTVTAQEAATTREAAVAKARPLARTLGWDG